MKFTVCLLVFGNLCSGRVVREFALLKYNVSQGEYCITYYLEGPIVKI